MIDQVIVPEFDQLALESIFPTPGRNEPCHCNSGAKYKKCCSSKDEEAWRIVVRKTREADAVGAALPKSIYPQYDLET